MNERFGTPGSHTPGLARGASYPTAAYRERLNEIYGSDVEMRDLALCRQFELGLEETDSGNVRFKTLFSRPVSGDRIASWLAVAAQRVRPHLHPEYIDTERHMYILPYMDQENRPGRIVIHHSENQDDQAAGPIASDNDGFPLRERRGVGWLYVYKLLTGSSGQRLDFAGLSLQRGGRLDPAVGAPIAVTTIRLAHSELPGEIPDNPLELDLGNESLIIRPYNMDGDQLTYMLEELDTALGFIAQD